MKSILFGAPVLALAPFMAAPRAQAAIPPPTVVALSGAPAPAAGSYNGFPASPVLNDAGQVAFLASLTGSPSTLGVFAGTPGSLQAVALRGAAAPAGGNYNAFLLGPNDTLGLNSAGQVAFTSTLSGGTSTSGIFVGTPGSIQAVGLQGIPAPAGGTYDGFNNALPVTALNNSGQVAFYSFLSGTAATTGIFAGAPGSIQTAALKLSAASAGGNYLFFSKPALNGTGQVAFEADLNGGTSNSGIFVGAPGSIQTAALQGTAAPAGGNYSNLGTSTPALNGAGQVAFVAGLTGGTTSAGLFVGSPGSLQLAAQTGTAAPAGGNYYSIGQPVLNGAGQVAFIGSLTSAPLNQILFVGAPGSIQVAASVGTPAPGGGNYSTFNPTSSPPVLNGIGEVAFTANLTGTGITSANDTALFAGLPGNLVQVVREGDVIDVDPGPGVDDRTVKANGISLLTGSGGEDGLGSSFNVSGLLVYQLTFTDGSTGIFTSQVTVPEPASLGLLALGSLAVARRARRSTKEA